MTPWDVWWVWWSAYWAAALRQAAPQRPRGVIRLVCVDGKRVA